MEPLLTWRYFLIHEDDFNKIRPLADELNDNLRNRPLSEEENNRKEELIDEINQLGGEIAKRTFVYKDVDDNNDLTNDGTIVEELVYRMDDAFGILRRYGDSNLTFPFLTYIPPEELQDDYDKIKDIFDEISEHDLLKKEFLGKWKYLERAREIFDELMVMYKWAFKNDCGVVQTDKLEWVDHDEDEDVSTEEIEEELPVRPEEDDETEQIEETEE
ncbi:MAG: hypothetical protein ACLFQV_09670 [Vulcanimicrobiota bacterium]